MVRRIRFPLILLALVSACGPAPESVPDVDLGQVRDSLQAIVSRGGLPGALLLVGVGDAPVQTVTAGFSDVESRRPLTDSSIFRLASTTKIWATVTLMTLVEDGQLDLGDPISRYIPEFGNADFFSPEGARVPAPREATILDLLRHTGGMGYSVPGFSADGPYRAALMEAGLLRTGGPFAIDWTHPWNLSEWAARLAAIPREAAPGTSFSYGFDHDVLGLVMERATGQSLDRLIADRVLDPLDLEDTGFMVAPERRQDLVSFYSSVEGRLELVETGPNSPFTQLPIAPSAGGGWDVLGNGGMVSSARDFARLLRMLLQGGEVDGVRILRRESVADLMRNHLDGVGNGDSYRPGLGFSFGFAYVREASRYDGEGHTGKIWWFGSTNVLFWLDPDLDFIGVFMANATPMDLAMMQGIEELAYAAVGFSSTDPGR